MLTPKEFEARQKVRQDYISLWMRETRNASHFRREDKKPWTDANMFGNSQDSQKSAAQRLRDQMAFAKAQMELGMLKSNPSIVPDWAKGPYFGPPKGKQANG